MDEPDGEGAIAVAESGADQLFLPPSWRHPPATRSWFHWCMVTARRTIMDTLGFRSQHPMTQPNGSSTASMTRQRREKALSALPQCQLL
jgi:hypothetical protein